MAQPRPEQRNRGGGSRRRRRKKKKKKKKKKNTLRLPHAGVESRSLVSPRTCLLANRTDPAAEEAEHQAEESWLDSYLT